MPLASVLLKLLGLSQALASWKSALAAVDAARREKIAAYVEAVAATFARAATAFARLDEVPGDATARRDATREIGRITGYVEDIVATLDDHFDGRKLAGIRRRLADLAEPSPLERPNEGPATAQHHRARRRHIAHLLEAEGYFRALADGLRT